MAKKANILVLWNQIEEDVYEIWQREGGRTLDWSPDREVPDVGTVAEEMRTFIEGLRQGGYDVRVVNLEDDFNRLIGAIRLYRPDAIFNLVEFFNDDASHEPYIAGVYELLGVPYTGCTPHALSACQNKFRTKVILEGAGLPTSPYFLARRLPLPRNHGLEYPLIVKPALEDASGGIEHASVVQDREALEERVRHVLGDYEMPALVEEYIEGREIHAAVLGNDPPEVLPLFEMEFDDSEFNPDGEWRPQIISYRAKWDPHSKDFYSMDSVCPAENLDPEMEDLIRGVAAKTFRALGCRDYARIDMRVDEPYGEVYVLEVNPNPDLVEGAAFSLCASASGRSYAQTVCEIAEMAVERGRRLQEAASSADADTEGLATDVLLREWQVEQARAAMSKNAAERGREGCQQARASEQDKGGNGGAGRSR